MEPGACCRLLAPPSAQVQGCSLGAARLSSPHSPSGARRSAHCRACFCASGNASTLSQRKRRRASRGPRSDEDSITNGAREATDVRPTQGHRAARRSKEPTSSANSPRAKPTLWTCTRTRHVGPGFGRFCRKTRPPLAPSLDVSSTARPRASAKTPSGASERASLPLSRLSVPAFVAVLSARSLMRPHACTH